MAVFTKNLKKNIFVHPGDQNKLHTAIKNALLEDKKKYSDSLAGALLDVSRIQVIGDHYLIVNGYLSMEVVADFKVFAPIVGMALEGVINKVHRNHYGCLVMDLFNASLSVPEDSNLQPQEGDNCSFVVTKLIVDGDLLFMRGEVTSVTPMEPTASLENDQETNLLATTASFLNGNMPIKVEKDEIAPEEDKSSKTYKKKHKSEKDDSEFPSNFSEQHTDVYLSGDAINIKKEPEETDDSFQSQPTKSPKKHKNKRRSDDNEFLTSSSEQHVTLEPSGGAVYIKRERESDNLLETAKSPKKHKKKHKSEDNEFLTSSSEKHVTLEPSGGAVYIKQERESDNLLQTAKSSKKHKKKHSSEDNGFSASSSEQHITLETSGGALVIKQEPESEVLLQITKSPKKHKKKQKSKNEDDDSPSSFLEHSGVASYIKLEPEMDDSFHNQKTKSHKKNKKRHKSESDDHV